MGLGPPGVDGDEGASRWRARQGAEQLGRAAWAILLNRGVLSWVFLPGLTVSTVIELPPVRWTRSAIFLLVPFAAMSAKRGLQWSPMISTRGCRRIAGALAVIVVLVGSALSPAGAHTALLQASPGPNQQAGGMVDFIDLAFTELVSGAVVSVSFDEQPISGATTVSEGQIIRFELDEPLRASGRYEVTYEVTSFDSDRDTGGFFFTYAPDAPQPTRLGLVEGEADGRNWLQIAAAVVLLSSLVGLLAMLVWRLDAKRRRAEPGDELGAR